MHFNAGGHDGEFKILVYSAQGTVPGVNKQCTVHSAKCLVKINSAQCTVPGENKQCTVHTDNSTQSRVQSAC